MAGKLIEVPFDPSKTQEAFIRSSVLENCFMGPRGEGKFIPYDTEIITVSGLKKAGDIRPLDEFIAIDGTPTPVVGIYPQRPQQLWKLKFSDGTSVVSSDDHLWGVETSWDREGGAGVDTRDRTGRGKTPRKASKKFPRKRRGVKIVKTHDIILAIQSGQWKNGGRWSIPLTEPVNFASQPIQIDPYILGVLLGDGSLSIKGVVRITTADQEIVEYVSKYFTIRKDDEYDYSIIGEGKKTLTSCLQTAGVIGCRAWEKFVPEMYLWNDVKIRMALLQGLLDTDGTILKHSNSVSYSTTSPQLAEDVIFLVRSLGGIAKKRTRRTQYTYKGEKKTGRLSYHISVRLPNRAKPFRLARKAFFVKDKGERNRPKRYIVGFEDAGIGAGVCFKVAHHSGLFLLHDFIPTHNTDAGIMAMTYHAAIQDKKYRPIPWAIVRDTWKNIERTTYRSLMYPTTPSSLAYQLRGKFKERDGGRQIKLVDGKGDAIWIAFLFGMDTPEDLNQVLSMQLGGLWLEEAAPAMQEEIGRGIGEDVWTMGITSLRHPLMSDAAAAFMQEWDKFYLSRQIPPSAIEEGVRLGALVKTHYGSISRRSRRAQITMNYPSEDHWTWVRFHDDPDPASMALFRIPKGENVYIDDQYRENMRVALRGRQDLLDRLVEGRPAHVQLGVAVTPEYHESLNGGPWHRSDKVLEPMTNIPVFRFWDGDLHPACHFAQITPRGKFIGFDTLRTPETGMGMKQFVDQLVKPLIANRYSKIEKWRDLGDPTLRDRDPSDSTQTAAGIIENELNTTYEGGVLRWGPRKEAMKDLLTRTLSNGEPMFVLSKNEKLMHRALSGGWHYNKSAAGKVSEEPDNADINSHPASGLSHGIAKIFKYQKEQRFILPTSKKKIAVGSSVQTLHSSGR